MTLDFDHCEDPGRREIRQIPVEGRTCMAWEVPADVLELGSLMQAIPYFLYQNMRYPVEVRVRNPTGNGKGRPADAEPSAWRTAAEHRN